MTGFLAKNCMTTLSTGLVGQIQPNLLASVVSAQHAEEHEIYSITTAAATGNAFFKSILKIES